MSKVPYAHLASIIIYYVLNLFHPYGPITVTGIIGPNSPTAVTALPGANFGSIRVMWVAPLDTGGVPISGYYIQYRIRGSTSYATQLSQPQSTEDTITGLRLGTTYRIRLATLTAIGIGPYCCVQIGSEVFARTHDGKQIIQSCNTCRNDLSVLYYINFVHNYLWILKSQPRCLEYRQFLV